MTTAVRVAQNMFDAAATRLVSHIEMVGNYREPLQRLQGVWDQLTLLGQMSGIAADITTTADEFRAHTGTLLDSLAHTLLRNTLHRMQAQAQVATDILVRNLFERTADVGFLATDTAVREFLPGTDGALDAQALQARFEACVAKYSVYDDVIVLGPEGRVCALLDGSATAAHCAHPLLAQALQPGRAFVESFGAIDLLGGRRGLLYSASCTRPLVLGLLYSAAIRAPRSGEAIGVLCLSFRFDDEMRAVFEHLVPVGPVQVVVRCDASGSVLASSDAWHVPIGAVLAPQRARDHRLFFAGRETWSPPCRRPGTRAMPGPAGRPARWCRSTRPSAPTMPPPTRPRRRSRGAR